MALSGKTKEMCIKALIAAHNVPDIAFEFLMSGQPIPDGPVGGLDDGGDDGYGDEGGADAGAPMGGPAGLG